jgi:DNA-directed RNA polymerase specialized sigma24 family protein
MSDTWPGDAELAALFVGVCARDPLAVNDFVLAVLEPLVTDLRRFPRTDLDACHSAATDAILALIRDPARYDPTRSELRGFLRIIARRKLITAIDKERRHHVGRKSSEIVELAADDGNSPANEPADDFPSFDDPHLAAELAGFNEIERAVFELLRDGERATAVFAAAMGLSHLPAEEQAAEAKRAKDRVKQRLKRAGGTT